jgi:predicted RNase H-like HicB family nuclease
MQVTCVFEEAAEGGYIAYVEEIPGANSQGETLEEARENLRDAITLLLEANRDLAERSLHERQARAIREAWTVGQE